MNTYTSFEKLENLINSSNLTICFFSSKRYWGSEDLLRKVDKLLFPLNKLEKVHIDLDNNPEIAANFSVFIAPTIIVFTYGKESIRESKFISIDELYSKIERYYSMIFQ